MYIFILLNLISSASVSDCLTLYSESTFANLDVLDLPSYLNLFELSFNKSELSEKIELNHYKCLIDLTYQPFNYPLLDSVCKDLSIYYITSLKPKKFEFSSLRAHSHSSLDSEVEALQLTLDYLNWKTFIIVSSNSEESLKIAEEIRIKNDEKIYTYIKYNSEISLENAIVLIRQHLKTSGVQRLLLVDKTKSCIVFQLALKQANFLGIGRYLLVSCSCVSDVITEGAVTLVEKGLEHASSLIDQEITSIELVLNEVNRFGSSSDAFSVLNYHNFTFFHVGNIENSVLDIFETIFYPGNTTSNNALENSVLQVSIANGTHEIMNLYNSTYMSEIYEGALVAASNINQKNEIKNFKIELFPTDCGIYFYHPNQTKACYSQIKAKMGLFYLAPLWEEVSIGALEVFKSFNMFLPQFSAIVLSDSLDNKTKYPEFLKLTVNLKDFFSSGLLYQKSMKWDSVVLISTNDSVSLPLYESTLKYAEILGIKIVNDEKYRVLPWTYTRENFTQYKEFFIHVKNTKCRIFYIIAWNRGLIWEALYDVGLRQGDVITITESAVLQYLTKESAPAESLAKRFEIIEGSIAYKFAEWQGDLGRSLKKHFKEPTYKCMTYDSMLVFKESMNYMLAKGLDYENPYSLMNVMRSIKFKGCTGLVYFAADTNSRGYSKFSFEQIRRNRSENASSPFFFEPVAVVDKFAQKIVTTIGKYQWNFETEGIPPNFLKDFPCGINPDEAKTSKWGFIILISLCSISLFVAAGAAVVFCQRTKEDPGVLDQEVQTTLADLIYQSFFALQALQILGLGVKREQFEKIYGENAKFLALELSSFYEIKLESYYFVYGFFLVLVSMWIVFCLFVLKKGNCLGLINSLQVVISSFGHLFFLALFSALLDLFNCLKSKTDSFQDTFFKYDCRIQCYQGSHLVFSVLSSVLINFYVTCFTLCRPLWEKYQVSHNLNTSSKFLCILSVWEVAFVSFSKILRESNEFLQTLLSLFSVGLLIGLVFVFDPYNYKRCKVLSVTCLTLAGWGILTSFVFERVDLNSQVSFIIQIIGFFVIGLVGSFLYKSYPELLKSVPGTGVEDLIKFQFFKQRQISREESYKISPSDAELKTIPAINLA